LKPENLLIDTAGYVKMADFGFAKKLPAGQKTNTLCGTPEYLAPELVSQAGHMRSVDW
jgi:cGMP-dependent protein kinase